MPHHNLIIIINCFSCVCVYCTFSLTRIAEHCRGTPIILCGFHVTELALQSLIYNMSEHFL